MSTLNHKNVAFKYVWLVSTAFSYDLSRYVPIRKQPVEIWWWNWFIYFFISIYLIKYTRHHQKHNWLATWHATLSHAISNVSNPIAFVINGRASVDTYPITNFINGWTSVARVGFTRLGYQIDNVAATMIWDVITSWLVPPTQEIQYCISNHSSHANTLISSTWEIACVFRWPFRILSISRC